MDSLRKVLKCLNTQKSPKLIDNLETEDDYKKRWLSIKIIYFTMFLMSLAFSIVLTGIWPYLDKLDPSAGKEFMGLVVGANPLGQMLFSPLFGWWGNKSGSIRLPLMFSLCLFTVASALYSSLETIPENVKYWMLGSRFLIGVSSVLVSSIIESVNLYAKKPVQEPLISERYTKDDEFQYIVSIELEDIIHFPLCVGTIIGSRSIVTAANCLGFHWKTVRKNLIVVAGSRYLLPTVSVNLIVRRVIKHVVHPRFSIKRFVYDIAVLTTDKAFEFDNYPIRQAPIKMATIEDGMLCEYIGWGIDVYFKFNATNIPLKATTVRTFNLNWCQLIFKINDFSQLQICAPNIAVCRSYLSAATRISERTGAVSMVSLAQVLGFIVGPGLQAAVTPLGDKGIHVIPNILVMNMYTASGWINVFMGIGNIIMFLPSVFEERKIAAREVMVMQGKGSEKETWKNIKPNYVSSWTLIVAFFVLVFNFVLLETLGASLTMDQFAWSKTEALYYMGMLMSVGAIVACATFVCIAPLCKRFPEQKVLIWGGFLLMVVGRLLCIPWGDAPAKIAETYNASLRIEDVNGNFTTPSPDDPRFLGCPETQTWCLDTPALTITQFLLGYAFTSIGYPIGVTLIQTIFSKILGPRPQGVWMGLMTGSGCLSRVMGPVFVGYIYTRLGTYWTFGLTAIMMFVSMIWLWLFSDRLIPPDFEKPSVEMQQLNPHKNGENDVERNVNSKVES